VKGAASEKAPERPVASITEVQALADVMPENQRIAVLLASWCQLRRGELLGLRRRDVDTLHGTVSVVVTRTKTMAGTMVDKAPKSDAGRRTIAVPSNILPALKDHFADSAHDADLVGKGLDPVELVGDPVLNLLLDVIESRSIRTYVVDCRLAVNLVPHPTLVGAPTRDVGCPRLQIGDLGSPERPRSMFAGGGNLSPHSPTACFHT
jgi:hypothetical protein